MSKKTKITAKTKIILIIGGSITVATAAISAPVLVVTTNAKKNEDANAAVLKSRIKLEKAKDDAKALIDNILIPTVSVHDAGLFAKIEWGKVAAKNEIDAATNINEIKSLVSYKDGSLHGSEFKKLQKLIEEYKIKFKEKEKEKAKDLIYAIDDSQDGKHNIDMISGNVWQIKKIKDEKYFIKFLKIMIDIFKEYKVNFSFDINNNSALESPIYSPTDKKIYITTDNAKIYYQQIIYQLSHEMIHQLIYEICDIQNFHNEYLVYSEILCSAFALYIIEYLGWNSYLANSLNEINQNTHTHSKYGHEIVNLFKNLKKNFDSSFKSALNKAINELKDEYNIQKNP